MKEGRNMKKLYKICAVLLILAGLLLALVSPLFLLFSAAGIGFLLYNPKKPELKLPERKPEPEKKPEPVVPRFNYRNLKIYDQDEKAVARFYKNHKDELEENPDYHEAKKELLESYYNEKVFEYEMTKFPCHVEGRAVWCEDGDMIGTIREDLPENAIPSLYLCGGKYKYVTEDSVDTDSDDHWFYLQVKTPNEQ